MSLERVTRVPHPQSVFGADLAKFAVPPHTLHYTRMTKFSATIFACKISVHRKCLTSGSTRTHMMEACTVHCCLLWKGPPSLRNKYMRALYSFNRWNKCLELAFARALTALYHIYPVKRVGHGQAVHFVCLSRQPHAVQRVLQSLDRSLELEMMVLSIYVAELCLNCLLCFLTGPCIHSW